MTRQWFSSVGAIAIAPLLVLAPLVADTPGQPPQPVPPRPAGAPLAVPASTKTSPTPFQFDVEALTLNVANNAVLTERYATERRFRPVVGLGKVSASNIRGGLLRIDQNSTTNIWLGPAGTFGHRLHHRDVYVALMTLPIDTAGRSTFTGSEAFPLQFTVRLKNPRFSGFEKFKIGLLDVEAFKAVASIAVGRVPTPFPVGGGGGGGGGVGGGLGGGFGGGGFGGGGGGSKTVDIGDLVSNPAVILNRVEEPDIMGEIILDHQPLGVDAADAIELTLRVERDGRIGGVARVTAAGQTRDIELAPKGTTDFFTRRASLPMNARLAAPVYVETLPKPTVVKVTPNQLTRNDLRSGGANRVNLRVEGVGFGPDTRLEIVPEGASGPAAAPIKATGLKLERKEGAAEGATLLAEVPADAIRGRSYSVRITTGGQTTTLKRGMLVR